MQNLRDQLLNAGVVDKKKKQSVETEQRRERKQKGAAQLQVEEKARQQAFAAQKAAEAEAHRQAEALRAAEKERREQGHRVRNIADRWAIRQVRPGTQRFYYAQRSGKIGRLLVDEAIYEQLVVGAMAIVERMSPEEAEAGVQVGPRRSLSLVEQVLRKSGTKSAPPAGSYAAESHVIVPWEAAERILAIDGVAVRFWARREAPVGIGAEQADAAQISVAG